MSHKLQKEIDTLLSTVDDTKMYAEFREEELIEITDGVHHDIARESLDHRIKFNMTVREKRHKQPLLQNTVEKAHQSTTRFFKTLFKPIHI